MVKSLYTTILLSLLALPAYAADTLADMDITVDPALVAYGIDPGVKHPRPGEVYRPEAVPQFMRPQIPAVAFIGDSIIAQFGTGWATDFGGALNLGGSGQTTAQILARIGNIPPGVRTVYIEGGVNNYFRGDPTEIPADYAKMIAGIPKGTNIRVIGILPINEAINHADRPQSSITNAQILAADAEIANVCAAAGNCAMVRQPFGKSLPVSATVDGLHLNASGYGQLVKSLRR